MKNIFTFINNLPTSPAAKLMNLEINGVEIDRDDNGHLVDVNAWNEDVCLALAEEEGIALTDRHWDVIKHLRDEFLTNNGNQPMERAIKKAMESQWDEKLSSKSLYELFPRAPSKQGALLAGLPATTRKGGY